MRAAKSVLMIKNKAAGLHFNYKRIYFIGSHTSKSRAITLTAENVIPRTVTSDNKQHMLKATKPLQ
jgi:hypothetical protein